MLPTIHVLPDDGGWAIKRSGSYQSVSTHRAQQDAIDSARALAERVHGELIIHGEDGEISVRHSFATRSGAGV